MRIIIAVLFLILTGIRDLEEEEYFFSFMLHAARRFCPVQATHYNSTVLHHLCALWLEWEGFNLTPATKGYANYHCPDWLWTLEDQISRPGMLWKLYLTNQLTNSPGQNRNAWATVTHVSSGWCWPLILNPSYRTSHSVSQAVSAPKAPAIRSCLSKCVCVTKVRRFMNSSWEMFQLFANALYKVQTWYQDTSDLNCLLPPTTFVLLFTTDFLPSTAVLWNLLCLPLEDDYSWTGGGGVRDRLTVVEGRRHRKFVPIFRTFHSQTDRYWKGPRALLWIPPRPKLWVITSV